MRAPSLLSLLASHWQAAWTLDAVAALAAGIYLWAAARGRSSWPRHRTVAFLAGIASVVLALQSGIGVYDDQLLSVHMVQHMLLLLVAPALLLLGQPVILALRVLDPPSRAQFARMLARTRRLTRPVICLAAFNAVVLGTHLPAFYEATLRHALLHYVEHALYLLAGMLLYWPLLGAEPVTSRRLGGLGRLIYMLAAMPAMALVGAYLNRHPTLVYPAYGPSAHALGISALADQDQAGAVMWVAGSVIMTAVGISSALAGMAAEERRQRLADARPPTAGAVVASPPDSGPTS
jgi:putative copper resistance protein D